MEKQVLAVHYNEIALKGKQRGKFEKVLRNNIFYSTGRRARSMNNRIFLDEWDGDTVDSLKLMPGVSWSGIGTVIERDKNTLKENLASLLSSLGTSAINFDIKRIDKKYSATSLELKNELMKELKIKLDRKGYPIRVEIMPDSFVINHAISKGIGGMPVGSAGKVLSLFSGGIDSAVAPFEMMKRGCNVDLLHVYALPTPTAVKKSKINDLVNKISKLGPTRLFLVPFHVFGIKAMETNPRYELVLFKRFLLKLAERISMEYGYKGICTGDALSQVASQTLDNISAISYGFDIPIFRPLLAYNKDEIIAKANMYGTYETSIKEYKDCCSIVSKNPATSASRSKVERLESEIGLNDIVNQSLSNMQSEEFTSRIG